MKLASLGIRVTRKIIDDAVLTGIGYAIKLGMFIRYTYFHKNLETSDIDLIRFRREAVFTIRKVSYRFLTIKKNR